MCQGESLRTVTVFSGFQRESQDALRPDVQVGVRRRLGERAAEGRGPSPEHLLLADVADDRQHQRRRRNGDPLLHQR